MSIRLAQGLIYPLTGQQETNLGYNHRRINHYNA